MDLLGRILDKLKEWVEKAIDALGGREPQSEPVPIPIPVRDRRHPRY